LNWLSRTFGEDSTVASDLDNIREELDSALELTRFLAKRLGACHSGLLKVGISLACLRLLQLCYASHTFSVADSRALLS
jgi:hypothetical protein